MRVVLDASVAVKWFVPEDSSDLALAALERFHTGDLEFIAPNIILAEFGHALRKHFLGKRLTAEQGRAFIERFVAMPIQEVQSRALARSAFDLVAAHAGTFYDALYLALAIREDLKVLTADEPMTTAFAKLDRTLHLADFSAS